MRSVLGIDAAWAAENPSGCALVIESETGWRLKSCAASYERFCSSETSLTTTSRLRGTLPQAQSLIAACLLETGKPPEIVAVDMPMAVVPITSRRASDQAVSGAYGGRGAGTHTPNAERPGLISNAFRLEFEAVGYSLLTQKVVSPGLVEVYPHPALIELASSPRRLPYKIQKARNYWPGLDRMQRRQRIFSIWSEIIALLDIRISGVADALQPPAIDEPLATLKSFEDVLDAVVCAWVGTCLLTGQALPFGDEKSAIWIPTPAGRPDPAL